MHGTIFAIIGIFYSLSVYASNPPVHGFGEAPAMGARFVELIKSVRTVMRCK